MTGYTITPARYAKGMMLVRCTSDGIFISRPARILRDDLNCRFTNREGGYIASARKVERLRQALAS